MSQNDKNEINIVHGAAVDSETLKKIVAESDKDHPSNDNKSKEEIEKAKKIAEQEEIKSLVNEDTKRKAKEYAERYLVGDRPDEFMARVKWRNDIYRKRQRLREELKDKGITAWRDFDAIATDLGLVYDWRGTVLGRLLWWIIYHWIQFSISSVCFLAAAILLITFLISYLTDFKGSFTINLTTEMIESDFKLYDDPDYESNKASIKGKARLIAGELDKVNDTSVTLLPKDIDTDGVVGSKCGTNYFATTFYIKNNGTKTQGFEYSVLLTDSMKDVEKAVWIMVFVDGKQEMYAWAKEDGTNEEITGIARSAPYMDVALKESQYYTVDEGKHYIIRPQVYRDSKTVMTGIIN